MCTEQEEQTRTFNDLVIERVLFLTDPRAKEILQSMFPDSDVYVFTDRGGKTVIRVDDVEVRIDLSKHLK